MLAARQVGPAGKVIGVDMTADWLPDSGVEQYVASAAILAVRPNGGGCCGTSPAAPCCWDWAAMLATEARESVATVMARLRPFVERRVAMAADVDDVLQDVLLRMYRGLPGLRASDRFGPWLNLVIRRRMVDYRAPWQGFRRCGDVQIGHAAQRPSGSWYSARPLSSKGSLSTRRGARRGRTGVDCALCARHPLARHFCGGRRSQAAGWRA